MTARRETITLIVVGWCAGMLDDDVVVVVVVDEVGLFDIYFFPPWTDNRPSPHSCTPVDTRRHTLVLVRRLGLHQARLQQTSRSSKQQHWRRPPDHFRRLWTSRRGRARHAPSPAGRSGRPESITAARSNARAGCRSGADRCARKQSPRTMRWGDDWCSGGRPRACTLPFDPDSGCRPAAMRPQ